MTNPHPTRCSVAAAAAAVLAVAVAGCRPPMTTATPVPATAPPAPAGAAPVSVASPSPRPLAGEVFELAGTRLVVPTDLAAVVERQEFPAVPSGQDAAPGGVVYTLRRTTDDTRPVAEVRIYHGPLADDAPASARDLYRPLFRLIGIQDLNPGSIPILPRTEGRRLLQSRIQYLGTAGGAGLGIRALIVVGDNPRPVANDELTYVFQGMVETQGAWISVRAPITVDDPLVRRDASAPTPVAFASGLPAYLGAVEARLAELPDTAFSPSIRLLDAVAKSVEVDWPAPSPDRIQADAATEGAKLPTTPATAVAP